MDNYIQKMNNKMDVWWVIMAVAFLFPILFVVKQAFQYPQENLWSDSWWVIVSICAGLIFIAGMKLDEAYSKKKFYTRLHQRTGLVPAGKNKWLSNILDEKTEYFITPDGVKVEAQIYLDPKAEDIVQYKIVSKEVSPGLWVHPDFNLHKEDEEIKNNTIENIVSNSDK